MAILAQKDTFVTTFAALGLAEPLLRALRAEGYEHPTPIQTQSIPFLLEGRDLLGIAQTGTGKTAAFALPILQRLTGERRRAEPGRARALVLAPTRELAAQIADSFRVYGKFAGVTVATVVGGVSMGPQVKQLARGVDVLVATPGRLLDHMSNRNVKLDQIEVVVLDEADHMLDLGFIVPIRQILSRASKSRQNLFFSATMPKEIAGLAAEILRNPVEVAVTPVATTVDRVEQHVYLVNGADKRHLLVELLARPECARTIVFTRTKRGADRVSEHLESSGVASAAIHGNKSQGQRQRALDGFRAGRTRVLVATDIAARGIDIDQLPHVVNYELPNVPEDYVHRIGRTGRAGSSGEAVSLVSSDERQYLKDIQRLLRREIPSTVIDGFAPGSAPQSGEAVAAPSADRKPGGKAPRRPGNRPGRPDWSHHSRPQKTAEHRAGKSRKVH